MSWTLAHPDDLKAALGWQGSDLDDEALRLVVAASGLAAEIAGRPLARAVDRVEHPAPDTGYSQLLRLDRYPVEAVKEVKSLSHRATEAELDAADALVESVDFDVHADLGRLELAEGYWPCSRHATRVTYTAGYLDARGVAAALVGAHVSGETTLDLDTAAVAEGDRILIDPGTAGEQSVTVSSVSGMDPTVATVSPALAADHEDATAVAIYPATAIVAGGHLVQAVIHQAVWWWNTRDKAGIRQIDLGDRGGAFSARESQMHPSMKSFEQLRRYGP